MKFLTTEEYFVQVEQMERLFALHDPDTGTFPKEGKWVEYEDSIAECGLGSTMFEFYVLGVYYLIEMFFDEKHTVLVRTRSSKKVDTYSFPELIKFLKSEFGLQVKHEYAEDHKTDSYTMYKCQHCGSVTFKDSLDRDKKDDCHLQRYWHTWPQVESDMIVGKLLAGGEVLSKAVFPENQKSYWLGEMFNKTFAGVISEGSFYKKDIPEDLTYQLEDLTGNVLESVSYKGEEE